MAAVSAPTGAVSPCTDAAIDSIRRRLLPVALTSWLMICAWRGVAAACTCGGGRSRSRRDRVDAACPSVDRSLYYMTCIAAQRAMLK